MDPSPFSISSSDLDLIPSLLTPPMIESQFKQAEATASNERGRAYHPLPNPNPNPNSILSPKNSIPNQQLSPDPDDGDLLSEYRHAAQFLFSSCAEKLRRNSGGVAAGSSTSDIPALAGPGVSTAIIPSLADPGISPAVATDDPGASTTLVSMKRKKRKCSRSAEMVRVSSASVQDLVISRDLVRRTRITFESLRSLLIRDGEKTEVPALPGTRSRPDLKAAVIMLESDLWLHRDKRIIGAIPGIHIGDVFFYRMELCIVGLHGQVQAGIDYVAASQSTSGEPVATSIVVSGGYEDDEDSGKELVYTGHGGRERNLVRHNLDQKLEGGNLALERSFKHGIEIRVIRGSKSNRSPTGRVYVYDGLYTVVECWPELGKSSFWVYKYKLVRLEGQDEMGSVILKLAEDLKKNLFSVRITGYLSLDISKGKEKLPVLLFNNIDDDQEPMTFDYLVRPVYTRLASQERRRDDKGVGCVCVSNCGVDCYCAKKNGGEFAYDGNGIILRGKPLIYECGKSCKCPSSCPNRVSQKGVRNRLEVFRSVETGWGVRSLDLIQSGSFICEFSGIVLTKQEAEVASTNGASLVYSRRFPARWVEWGDISDVFPECMPPDFPSLPELSFSLDVSRVRNVASYLSHSCSPNVFLQFVLFDHYNESYPHLMVFAMENIPPMTELSIDYGVS